MASGHAASPEPAPGRDELTARMVGTGTNFPAEADADADIESTLSHPSALGIDEGDVRVLAVLTTWLGVHHTHMNADGLVRLVGAHPSLLPRPSRVEASGPGASGVTKATPVAFVDVERPSPAVCGSGGETVVELVSVSASGCGSSPHQVRSTLPAWCRPPGAAPHDPTHDADAHPGRSRGRAGGLPPRNR